MDFSGTQSELPMPMHAGGTAYLDLHHAHEHQQVQHHSHGGANGRQVSRPEAEEEEASKNRQALAVVPVSSSGGGVWYRECLKNHAAASGGSATDGCGEFMPAGEEGSLDALRCSACGCHRNFHRKEPSDGVGGRRPPHHQLGGPQLHHRGLLVAALPPAPTRMVMPLSAAMHHHQHHATSAESDDARAGCSHSHPAAPARKRFRTKFTAEQKARMLGFAEEAGWRLQKLDDDVVQRFCQEVGVKRRVLKVWMHNNKHTLAARRGRSDQPAPGDGAGGLPPCPELGGPGRSPGRSPPPQQLRLE
jgi:ZF-HD class homeobox domain-containing protein